MNTNKTINNSKHQEIDEGSTWQLKLVLTIIGLGIIVWVLEFAGVFH
jgi:hypothetical protein